MTDQGVLSDWHYEQPPGFAGEEPVITLTGSKVSSGEHAVRFNLTQAYIDAPSPWVAYREYAELHPGAPMDPSRTTVKGDSDRSMEDKKFPKDNSLLAGGRQELASGIGIGWAAHNFGWHTGFSLIVASGILSGFFFALTWRVKPRFFENK